MERAESEKQAAKSQSSEPPVASAANRPQTQGQPSSAPTQGRLELRSTHAKKARLGSSPNPRLTSMKKIREGALGVKTSL